MLTPEKALDMRERIGAVGLDFRDVYVEVGIETETDTTQAQLEAVNRIITTRGGASETPVSAVDAAAEKAITAVHNALASHGACARHVLVLVDADDVPDNQGNASLAGFGYDGPLDVFNELMQHCAEIAEKLGMTMNVIMQDAPNQG